MSYRRIPMSQVGSGRSGDVITLVSMGLRDALTGVICCGVNHCVGNELWVEEKSGTLCRVY